MIFVLKIYKNSSLFNILYEKFITSTHFGQKIQNYKVDVKALIFVHIVCTLHISYFTDRWNLMQVPQH